jgi:RNA recognition motif-containing protein
MRMCGGHLAWSTTEDELPQRFAPSGAIARAHILTARATSRSRGCGVVARPNRPEAHAALVARHGTAPGGRPFTVNEARAREGDARPRRPGEERRPREAGAMRRKERSRRRTRGDLGGRETARNARCGQHPSASGWHWGGS